MALPAEYVDARRCVITNNEHGNAEPLLTNCGNTREPNCCRS